MLEVFEPGPLNYFTFSQTTLSTLSVSKNPILTPLLLSEISDSLLCVLIAPTPGLAFSLLMPRTLAVVSLFLLDRAYSTSSLSSLDLYSDYVGVIIFLNNSSSLSFLNMFAPLFAPLLISPLLPSLLPFLAPGRCFRTWVLTPYQFFYMSLSLSGLSPQRAYPFLRFSESSLEWFCFPLSICRGILVSFLCCCSLYLSGTECGQMFHSFRLHQTPF